MQIKQKSLQSFILKSGDTEVLINPDFKYEEGIAIFSAENLEGLVYNNDRESELTVASAGEYESKDIFITGKKSKGRDVIVYDISLDDLHVGYISYLNDSSFIPVELFASCDILMIGVGGGENFFTSKDAHEIIQKISPKAAIVFGLKEQQGKKENQELEDLASIQMHIPGIKLADKNFKISKTELSSSDNTDVYYFEL